MTVSTTIIDGDNGKDGKAKITEDSTPGFYIKARYVLVVMGFFGIFNVYSLRSNLSVAIVAMVNSTTDVTISNGSDTCPDKGSRPVSFIQTNGIFNWNSADQGLLLGCYFYGYIFSNIPGAWLAKRYGFKYVLGIAMTLSSIITLCFPSAAYNSFELAVALRIILGLLQGVSFPSMYTAWGWWAPPLERSILVSVTVSGLSLGTCITLSLAGVIAGELGWEAVFYVTGGIALFWSLVWFAIIHNTPEEHPRISKQERTYIVESIGISNKKDRTVKVRTPWISIFTSPPFLSIVLAQYAATWGNYSLLTMLPTYMSTILNFDLAASGALAAVPFILQGVFTVGGGVVTDVIRKHNITSTTTIKKIDTTLGLVGQAIFVVLAGYIGCDATAAIVFFTMSLAFNALPIPGCESNSLELSPKYGGIIYAIANTIGNTAGFLAPQIVGLLLLDGVINTLQVIDGVKKQNSLEQWQLVFWICAGLSVLGAVVYLIFGSAEEQDWASGRITKKEIDKDHQSKNNMESFNGGEI